MKSNGIVKSRFNHNESFGYDRVPKHFWSVTDASIKRIRVECLKKINRDENKYAANTLKDTLGMIAGYFEQSYVVLWGDYRARQSNLKEAYIDGVSVIHEDIINFKQEVDEHDALYEEYADIAERLTGIRPSESLKYDRKELEKIMQDYDELDKKGK